MALWPEDAPPMARGEALSREVDFPEGKNIYSLARRGAFPVWFGGVFQEVVGMKKEIAGSLALCGAVLAQAGEPSYRLVWEESFEGTAFDERSWSKIPRGKSPWNTYMSDHDSLYEVKDGNLVLYGRKNDGLDPKDPSPYLTGGLYTKGKKTIGYGKVEVRARIPGAQGSWPAIWMLSDTVKWPDGGEIDIVERLNFDPFGYQTIHSHYTYDLKQNEPEHGDKGPIDPKGYNVYAAEILPDKVILSINGKPSLVYPKIETDKEGQFPFGRSPAYLLIDMQLGGDWAGPVDEVDLPARMEIDWVKFYELDDPS